MIRSLIARRLKYEERRIGLPLEYVRHILRTSTGAFIRYACFIPMSRYRRRLPADAFHVARLVATQRQDCGTCVQIEVNLARKDGVPADVIRAVLNNRPEDLTRELADVYRFAKSVVEASGGEEELRERMRKTYGEEGLVELALGIAAARVFPVTKRALGYATSCALVKVKI